MQNRPTKAAAMYRKRSEETEHELPANIHRGRAAATLRDAGGGCPLLHRTLPDMTQHCFLAFGVLGAHPSDGTAFAKIAPAFVILSKLTNSSYLRFPAFFTGIFYHLARWISFSSRLREKGHLSVTFFNSLKYRQSAVLLFGIPMQRVRFRHRG